LGENNAWLLHTSKVTAEQPEWYYSTAEEADSRIWQHAMQSQIIYSPHETVYLDVCIKVAFRVASMLTYTI